MKLLPFIGGILLLFNSCVWDNSQDMFPHVVIPDSTYKGQVAWFPFDSGLVDQLGQVEPLRFWGSFELGRDHRMIDSAAIVMDGVEDYLAGLIGLNDSMAVSMWFLPLPNYPRAYLFDYGIGRFTAGIDAVTSATMPRFSLFMKQDTTEVRLTSNPIDFFFWHHLYIEIGDTANYPRIFIDGYPLFPPDSTIWRMHTLTDMLYLARPFNPDIMDTLMYRGYLDEIRIFNVFLTEEEILNLYWEGKPSH
jgi:hypothetical protein